ncbi:hypothetical protein T492DRAFT_844331 [Pavlovales sp. CCMP2436]|nr:hypothetical protein T492DRAFT_844331 [Pavlovales sp. CCMP2436]
MCQIIFILDLSAAAVSTQGCHPSTASASVASIVHYVSSILDLLYAQICVTPPPLPHQLRLLFITYHLLFTYFMCHPSGASAASAASPRTPRTSNGSVSGGVSLACPAEVAQVDRRTFRSIAVVNGNESGRAATGDGNETGSANASAFVY